MMAKNIACVHSGIGGGRGGARLCHDMSYLANVLVEKKLSRPTTNVDIINRVLFLSVERSSRAAA